MLLYNLKIAFDLLWFYLHFVDSKSQKGVHQVFLQQSVTLLALKDKTFNNGTVAPDLVHPKLFFGIVNEDIPVFIGAVIGIVLSFNKNILVLLKCCS